MHPYLTATTEYVRHTPRHYSTQQTTKHPGRRAELFLTAFSRVKGTNLVTTADIRHFAHWIFSLY